MSALEKHFATGAALSGVECQRRVLKELEVSDMHNTWLKKLDSLSWVFKAHRRLVGVVSLTFCLLLSSIASRAPCWKLCHWLREQLAAQLVCCHWHVTTAPTCICQINSAKIH
ncbi:hypothetical protein M0657_005285 [Pyricularia oryzae]|nr:hypothetical protein M0657_005285 [Pyricularia oryzae]KAI7926056.1 hypothetical protein M9X92_003012 [Pyricularia oryzae]